MDEDFIKQQIEDAYEVTIDENQFLFVTVGDEIDIGEIQMLSDAFNDQLDRDKGVLVSRSIENLYKLEDLNIR